MKKAILTIVAIATIATIWSLWNEKKHNDYAIANGCDWTYYSNGFEVCK